MPLSTFDHDGLTFELDDAGEGSPVILLHGFPQTRTSWHQVAPALVAAGHRVLAPDQRGYSPGARPGPRRAYALDLLAGDVLALADAAGLDRFHVVGHDWGAAVAWALGATCPERLASLTALSTPHPRAVQQSVVRSTQLLRSAYIGAFQLPLLPELLLRAGGGCALHRALVASGLPDEQAAASVALVRSDGGRAALHWYRAIPFAPPGVTAPVPVPTLFVHGAQDPFLTRQAADLTAGCTTGPYRYEIWEDAGHWLPEQGARLVPLLLEHLGAHEP